MKTGQSRNQGNKYPDLTDFPPNCPHVLSGLHTDSSSWEPQGAGAYRWSLYHQGIVLWAASSVEEDLECVWRGSVIQSRSLAQSLFGTSLLNICSQYNYLLWEEALSIFNHLPAPQNTWTTITVTLAFSPHLSLLFLPPSLFKMDFFN